MDGSIDHRKRRKLYNSAFPEAPKPAPQWTVNHLLSRETPTIFTVGSVVYRPNLRVNNAKSGHLSCANDAHLPCPLE